LLCQLGRDDERVIGWQHFGLLTGARGDVGLSGLGGLYYRVPIFISVNMLLYSIIKHEKARP
jgi:hypothetical protein